MAIIPISSMITEVSSSMAVGTLRPASNSIKVRAMHTTAAVHLSIAECKGLPLIPRVQVGQQVQAALKASEAWEVRWSELLEVDLWVTSLAEGRWAPSVALLSALLELTSLDMP